MDAVADYRYDFTIKGVTEFIRASPLSLRPNFAPSISFHFISYVNLYDWNNDRHSAPADIFCLGEYEPAYRSDPPNISGFISHDFENWRYSSLGEDLYSNHMSTVNPNITFGSEVHRDIQSEIWRIIEDVYSEPNCDSDHQCTILTRLVLHITINEHVLNECACEECRPIAEKKLPASEASIKKLNKVRVVAAAAAHDLEEKKHENCRRSTRLKTSKKGSERPSDGDQCSICAEGFTAGKFVTQMPCSHSFHKPCIDRWLRTSYECPLCRYKMLAAPERRERAKLRRISEI